MSSDITGLCSTFSVLLLLCFKGTVTHRFFNFYLKWVAVNIKKWIFLKFSRKFSKQISYNFPEKYQKISKIISENWGKEFLEMVWKLSKIISDHFENFFRKFFKLNHFEKSRKLFWKTSRNISENFKKY